MFLMWIAVMVLMFVAAIHGQPAEAQDFYKDKTIRFIVGYSA
jgi:hypothetical protein